MNISLAHAELCLSPGRAVRLNRAQGWIVSCLSGDVWITEPTDPEDRFLKSGESYRIQRQGLTLLEGLTTARIALHAPAETHGHEHRNIEADAVALV